MSTTEDRELERYLQRSDALSRAYAELKSERPSPALDHAVLAQARAALRIQPRAHRSPFRGWPAITAIAATVLLSFTLVMRVVLESEMPQPNSASSPAASAPVAVKTTAPKALEERASPIEKSRPVIEAEIRAAAEQPPAIAEPVLQESARSSLEALEAERPASAPPELDASRDALAAPTRQMARERADESSSAPAAERSVQPAAPAAEGLPYNRGSLPAESLAKKEQLKPPEEWLEEIARLRASGDVETADRELELFKQAYPGYLESQASPADK